ncbi:leucine-rich repeat domain-containing protein [Streptomyces californicus]
MTSPTGAEHPHDLVAAYSELLGSAKRPQARKAVRELAVIADDGAALELAAAFAPVAALTSDTLVRLWPEAHDPDGFAASLLAPAFREEGRTELKRSGWPR